MNKYPERIIKIVEMLDKTNTLVDFGCDHGFAIKKSFSDLKIKKAYAIDNKEKPLSNAKNNLKGFQVEYILASSFVNLKQDFDTCIISGLGSKTIIEILKNAPRNKTYILGSNLKTNLLRLFLKENNFKIIAEKLVFENNHYYELIKAIDGKMDLDEKELYTGLFLKEDLLFKKFCLNKISNFKKLLNSKNQSKINKIISFYE